MTKQQLIAEAKALGPRERTELMEELRQVHSDVELTAEQIAELHRRVDAVDRGEEKSLPGEQIMREIFARVGLTRP